MKRTILFTLLAITALSSCKKYLKEEDLDKQIIVEFPMEAFSGINSTQFADLPPYTYLTDFNKGDYAKVDSITFHAILGTQGLDDSISIRLFNMTDSVEIPNTVLSTSGPKNSPVSVRTNNIFNSLPDKKITLAIQMKGRTFSYSFVQYPYLKLRRN